MLAKAFQVRGAARVQLLSAGIAGGFGAVFGTPIAGTVFGVEVVRVGRIEYHALIPALVAALTGDYVTRALGIQHTAYPHVAELALTLPVAGKALVLALGCALASILFIDLTHALKAFGRKHVRWPALRLFAGGCAVVALWRLSGTDDYLGLSVPLIVRSFGDPAIPYGAFLWKIVFTAVTLGAGFLGGEVTPLFCIGATLGNVMGRALGLPLDLAAACGFAAVFGAAANTPLACAIMAVELFGSNVLPHAALVCIFAYLLTGHRGIYPSQRILVTKHGDPIAAEKKLGEL
jgi:H+/Cl- antiporter ClcA